MVAGDDLELEVEAHAVAGLHRFGFGVGDDGFVNASRDRVERGRLDFSRVE